MNIYKDLEKVLGNTEYAILHGWHSLPDHHDSDLDISIKPEDLDVLEKSLYDFRSGKLVQMFQHESSCFYFILSYRNGGGTRFLQVDVATDYRRNGLTFFPTEKLNGGRQKWKDFWVVTPETELAYLLVKKTLKGQTPGHQKSRLKYLIKKLGEETSTGISKDLFGSEFGQAVITWIRDDNWVLYDSSLNELKKALVKQTIKKNPLNPIKYRLSDAKRIIKRWLIPTGLFVAVLGPDGAGKSTIISDLEKDLSGAFRRKANYHLRPGLLGKRGDDAPVTEPHAMPVRSFAASTLKLAYYVSDYLFGYLLKLYPKLARSTMIIFDRYYDDLLVDPVRYRYGGSTRLAAIGRYLVPRPDLFIVLDASEDVLLKRKKEVERNELTRQRRAYLETATKLSNGYILDSARSPEEIKWDVSELITEYLHVRYKRWRGHYFPKNDGETTVDWLTEVLSADQHKYYFIQGETGRQSGESNLKTYYEFKYLPVRDGRGYLLPTNRIPALNGLNLYNVRSRKAKMLKLSIRACYTCGLSDRVLKTVRLVSTSDGTEKGPEGTVLFEYIKEKLGIKDLEFALSLGTPGPDRKPVIQIQNGDGLAVGYAKVGWNKATKTGVKNEAVTIKNISEVSFKSFEIPRLIHAGDWSGRYVTILSSPEGKVVQASGKLCSEYTNVVNELANFNCVRLRLKESPFWSAVTNRVKNISSRYFRNILEHKTIPVIEDMLADKPLPFHLSHGDFTPWNAYFKNGRLFLYDWEHSSPDSPVGWDLFHFLFQTKLFLENKTAYELYKTVPVGTFEGPAREYWEKIGADEDTAGILFLLYVTGRLVFEASCDVLSFERLNVLAKVILLTLNDQMEKF